VFGPFLTLKTQGSASFEEGYNTSLPPGTSWTYEDAKDPTTTNIKVGDLVKDTGVGVPANYFIFDLDLNRARCWPAE